MMCKWRGVGTAFESREPSNLYFGSTGNKNCHFGVGPFDCESNPLVTRFLLSWCMDKINIIVLYRSTEDPDLYYFEKWCSVHLLCS